MFFFWNSFGFFFWGLGFVCKSGNFFHRVNTRKFIWQINFFPMGKRQNNGPKFFFRDLYVGPTGNFFHRVNTRKFIWQINFFPMGKMQNNGPEFFFTPDADIYVYGIPVNLWNPIAGDLDLLQSISKLQEILLEDLFRSI